MDDTASAAVGVGQGRWRGCRPIRQRGTNVLATEEIRGVWMWSSDIRQEGAEAVAERLARHHINKVFFLVKGTSGSVCYPSKLAPGPESGQDALKAILDACHKRHIEVHAWYMFNSDTAWGRKHPEDIMWVAGKPQAWNLGPRAGHRGAKHPYLPAQPGLSGPHQEFDPGGIGSLPGGRNSLGRHPLHPCAVLFLSASPGPRRHEWHSPGEGAAQAIYDTFYAADKKRECYFNLDRAGDLDVAEWVSLREKAIDQAIKEIREVVKGKNPSLVLSAAFMPEGGEPDDTFARCHYAQNYASAGSQLDYILPMTYHKSFGKGPEWVVRVAQNAESKSHRPVYSGIQAFERDPSKRTQPADDKTGKPEAQGISAQELRDTVTTVEKRGIKGFVLFRYGSVTDQMWEGPAPMSAATTTCSGTGVPEFHRMSATEQTRQQTEQ